METKALNYTAAEINQRLNLAGTAVQPNALNDYYTKTVVDSMVVVDLSVRYATSYASLSAALTALNADTDASAIKVGGMSIKFINSTNSKYEQWNLKASAWSINTSDWTLDVDGSVANDKLKLPFELEKPSSSEYVTQASEIGYGDSNVVDEIHRIYDTLGSELTITAFSNDGRLKDDGTIGTHVYAKTSDFILLDNKIIKQIKCCFRPTESDVNYCGVAFYSQNNESSFLSCIRDTTGGTNVGGGWYLCTYNYVSIPEGAHYMRVTAHPGITQEGKITLVTAQLQDETPTRNSSNGVKSGGVFSAIYGDRGSKQFFTLDNSSKIEGNNVVLAGFNFVYAQINGTTYRNIMNTGTYTVSGNNRILYVIPSASTQNITPQVASINASREILDTKNIVVIAYTNNNGTLFFNTTNIRLSDIMASVDDKISTLEGRFSVVNKTIATINSWDNYAYNADGTISAYTGYHAEVAWDASRPKTTVMLNWSLQGSVRYIVFKDASDNVSGSVSFASRQYPIIIDVPAGTAKLLVSKYNYNNISPEGNEIYQITAASDGSYGLINMSASEIIAATKEESKIEILGFKELDITSFPNNGRLKADGTIVTHSYCKTTNYIPLDDRLIKTIRVCFNASESNVDYCAVAFYGQDNEESFISCIRSTTGGTTIAGGWKAVTYTEIPIPEGAHYMRVNNNMNLYNSPLIIVKEFNKISAPIYDEVYTEDIYFTYDVDCGIDDIEDSLKSTNIQGETVLGTDNGYIRFAYNYSATGIPTPLVILNHGAGGSVTGNHTENGSSSFAKLLAKKGYNVLCINGVPTTFRNTKYLNGAQNGAATHMGGWVYQRSAICAYKYVTQKYNISKDGCAVIGRSMGGVTSLNLAFLGSIPVKVLALDAPVIDSYKDAYFSGNWSGGTLGGSTPAIFAWIFQWDYCDFTNDTYTIPVGTYTIHGVTYSISSEESKSLASLKDSTQDMIIMWYLNRNKMAGYNAYKTGNFLIHNLDNNYTDNQTTDNDDNYFGKKLPCPCKIWFGSGDTTNQQIIAKRFVNISRNGGSVTILRTAPSNVHCIWAVTKALDGTTDISVVEDGITCSPYGVELAEWIMRYLPNVQ